MKLTGKLNITVEAADGLYIAYSADDKVYAHGWGSTPIEAIQDYIEVLEDMFKEFSGGEDKLAAHLLRELDYLRTIFTARARERTGGLMTDDRKLDTTTRRKVSRKEAAQIARAIAHELEEKDAAARQAEIWQQPEDPSEFGKQLAERHMKWVSDAVKEWANENAQFTDAAQLAQWRKERE